MPLIANGTPDIDTPEANAVVRVTTANGTACTGTLITPQVILSANHCQFYDHGPALVEHPETATWVSLASLGAPNIEAQFGVDREALLETIPVRYVNIPGNRDLVLLSLERPVSAEIAVPMAVLLDPPPGSIADPEGFWSDELLRIAGWGLTEDGSPTVRQSGTRLGGSPSCAPGGSWFADPVSGEIGAFCPNLPSPDGSAVRGGDSGGPLIWTDPETGEMALIGVLQGGARYSSTWTNYQLAHPGNLPAPPENRIDLTQRDWLLLAIDNPGTPCGGNLIRDFEGTRYLPLNLWWHAGRQDNFTTSDPRWYGCPGEQKEGYVMVETLGMVHHPDYAQPPQTQVLHEWWNAERGDNFITSDPRWDARRGRREPIDGYVHVRRAGYVPFVEVPGEISVPRGGTPATRGNTTPLWHWWSPGRTDNFLTNQPYWEPIDRGPRDPDYEYFRLEGYVLDYEPD
ncbi:MAG: trypsin-like serine protease [Pseudomonadota bacterium]